MKKGNYIVCLIFLTLASKIAIALASTSQQSKETSVVEKSTDEKALLTSCLNYYKYDKVTNTCVHDGFWPIDFMKVIEILILSGVSLIATACGIGGGAIYSTCLILIENFPINEAFPITTCLMFFCSFCTYYMGIVEKRRFPDTKFVDYDLVVIICPMMLLGTKCGAIINKISPNIVLNFIFLLFVGYSTYKTYCNAIRLREIEQEEEKKRARENFALESENNTPYLEQFQLKDISDSIQLTPYQYGIQSPAFNLERMKIFFLFLVLIIVDQMIEGNDRFPSIIGIKKCSSVFWIFFIGFSFLCYILGSYFFKEIIQERSYIYNNIENFDFSSNLSLDEKANKIFLFSFLGGFTAGMLGLGGGLIIVPLLLSLNVDTRVTVTTSNLMIVFSSLSGTILFIFSGQLRIDHAFFISIPCLISAFLGNTYINNYIRETNRTSFLVFFVCGIMILSLFISPLTGIYRAVFEYNKGIDILRFNDFC